MKIKRVEAKEILDSRKDKTIEISVFTDRGKFSSSAPEGKSKGRFEAKPYARNLQQDILFLNNLKTEKLKIEEFKNLIEVDGLVNGKVGANSLFAFEAGILKALAAEQEEELWEFLSRGKPKKLPFPVGNAIGGGLHGEGVKGKEPDFQEFLFIPKTKKFFDGVFLNKQAHKLAGGLIKAKKVNDEGAWQTSLNDEKVLEVMSIIKHEIKKQFGEDIELGIDIAASSFFDKNYNYKNKANKLNREQQIGYTLKLAKNFDLFYIEDPIEQEDFAGFAEIKKKTGSLIVGDDLTVTNLTRLKKAVQCKSINGIIIKPNQNGSLLKVKEICDFCGKNKIKTIFSHRSGETLDNSIADLAVAWNADFIKTGIYGKEREIKLNRIIEIEKSL